jgi:integrase
VGTGGERALETLDAEAIRTFLVARVAGRSLESARLLSIGLRSFLRFLVLRGVITRDLSGAVPRVRTYQQTSVPVVLSPDDVERALATADRSTPRGRRDYAIVLLLARLGLRASEVMALELEDLHWRAAEIVVRGKGPRRDHVPLLADVGDALAQYLREDRGASPSRRVFLRLIPPRVGLSRPCAIDHIVRLALQRAGIGPYRRRVAHQRWAMAPQGVQRATWARRLSMARRFATWRQAHDPQTEVPPYGALPGRRRRRRPHIFTDDEVRRLMAQAARARSRTGVRPLTYSTLIGLLAATGLCPGEALALDTADVDLDTGLLLIRQSKCGMSRVVPVDDSTREALRQYLARRTALCLRPRSPAFLLSEHGRCLRGNATRRMFAVVSCAIGLRPPLQRRRWGRGPRLQDLRHTFATRRLVEWYRDGVDVTRVLPTLATYLGHVGIGLTYWYIEAVPELLAHARTRLGSPGLPGGPR